MASTRNKNTPGNYCLQQRSYANGREYLMYEHASYGSAYDTRTAGNGLNPGYVPWNKLSNNAPDIESFLFGIGSTNLVKPQEPLKPELKCLKSNNLYKMPDVYIPEPLVVSKTARPFLG